MSSWLNNLTSVCVDVAAVLRFRRGRVASAKLSAGLLIFLAVTGYVVYASTIAAGSLDITGQELAGLLPAGLVATWALTLTSAIALGGGRELVPRDQATSFPIRPAVDHTCALLLAPLNVAWLLQLWMLLGFVGLTAGWPKLLAGSVVAVLWLATATAWSQALAWCVEAARRQSWAAQKYQWIFTWVVVAIFAITTGAWLSAGGADRVRILDPVVAAMTGQGGVITTTLALLGLAALGAMVGVWPAAYVNRLPPRTETRLASRVYLSRPLPQHPILAMTVLELRGVWRSAPLRRGIVMLIGLPAIGMVLVRPDANSLYLLPSLVASGSALLFAINAWCLEGSGLVWRESQPVSAQTTYLARSLTALAVVGGGSMLTLVVGLATLRWDTPRESWVMVSVAVVCVVQVVATSMAWSVRRPYKADLQTARATPAPPIAMLGYSCKLAFSTTFTVLGLGVVLLSARWWICLVFLAVFFGWSGWRWWRAGQAWETPSARSLVVTTMAAV